jgi:hypothetical protein
MMFNANFNNISVMKMVSFIGGGNRSIRRKPIICRMSLNFGLYRVVRVSIINENVYINQSSTDKQSMSPFFGIFGSV